VSSQQTITFEGIAPAASYVNYMGVTRRARG
jgi:hypothetical protein